MEIIITVALILLVGVPLVVIAVLVRQLWIVSRKARRLRDEHRPDQSQQGMGDQP